MASKPGLLGWFVSNPIAANLLMVVLVIGGLYNIPGLDKQFFPTPVIDRISISMPFPGASPREVEEQICVRIICRRYAGKVRQVCARVRGALHTGRLRTLF